MGQGSFGMTGDWEPWEDGYDGADALPMDASGRQSMRLRSPAFELPREAEPVPAAVPSVRAMPGGGGGSYGAVSAGMVPVFGPEAAPDGMGQVQQEPGIMHSADQYGRPQNPMYDAMPGMPAIWRPGVVAADPTALGPAWSDEEDGGAGSVGSPGAGESGAPGFFGAGDGKTGYGFGAGVPVLGFPPQSEGPRVGSGTGGQLPKWMERQGDVEVPGSVGSDDPDFAQEFDVEGRRVWPDRQRLPVWRSFLPAERQRLRDKTRQARRQLAAERGALEAEDARLRMAGATAALYETQLRNLGAASAGRSPDSPQARRYEEIQDALQRWHGEHPEYREARAAYDEQLGAIDEREQAEEDRRARVAALAGNGMATALSGSGGTQEDDPLTSRGLVRGTDADPAGVMTWGAALAAKNLAPTAVGTLRLLSELHDRGVQTVGGRPISDVLAEAEGRAAAAVQVLSDSGAQGEQASQPGAKKPEDDPGDFTRGVKVAFKEVVPLAEGALGLLGATAERFTGKGGWMTALKNWGLRGYRDGMAETQGMAHDTDDISHAWSEAKKGNVGALVDWAQYGLGYLAGQLGESVAVSVISGLAAGAVGTAVGPEGTIVGGVAGAAGGIVAKGAAKGLIRRMVLSAVEKQAGKMVEEQALKQGLKLTGKEVAEKVANHEVRQAAAKAIGRNMAALGNGLVQEAGSIYPEAVQKAAEEGRELTGAELAKVWAFSLAASGVDTLTEKLGLDEAAGKIRLGGTGRSATAAKGAISGAVSNGAEEGVQTVLERLGAGQSVTDADARRDYLNSAALGALGGSATGVFARPHEQGKSSREQADAPDFGRLSAAYDDALEKARTAREGGDVAAHEQHMDAARRLAAAMAGSAGQSRQRVAPEVRSRLAREASPEANPEEEHEAIASDPAVPFASAEIGRGLREAYHGPQARERFAVIADEAGVHPEEAQRIADQHTAFAAGRDLQKILEGGRTTPEREAALEKLGLLTLDRNADGSTTARVTDDATPLLPKATREALAQDANAYGDRYEVTPGTLGDAWASHADAGRRRFAESAGVRQAAAGRVGASPEVRIGNGNAGISSPVDAASGTTGTAAPTLDPRAFQHPDARVRNLAKAWQRLHEILGEGRELNTSQRAALHTATEALEAVGMLRNGTQQASAAGAASVDSKISMGGLKQQAIGASTPFEPNGAGSASNPARFDPHAIIAAFARRYARVFGLHYTNRPNATAGVAITRDGKTLVIQSQQLEETLAAVPAEQREAKLRAMLDEELVHAADIAVNGEEESAALWKSLPESIRRAVQAIYTRERVHDEAWTQMDDAAKAREFKRMLVQQQAVGGAVSELMEIAAREIAEAEKGDAARSWAGRLLRHLRKMAAWLTGNDAKEAMRQVRAIIDELARIQSGGEPFGGAAARNQIQNGSSKPALGASYRRDFDWDRERYARELGEGPEIDAIHETTPYRGGYARPPRHHIFPKEKRSWFTKRGINIDQYTVQLSEPRHHSLHGGGNWKLGRLSPDEWNSQIMSWLALIESEKGGLLTPEEILSVGQYLLTRYDILNAELVHYNRAR